MAPSARITKGIFWSKLEDMEDVSGAGRVRVVTLACLVRLPRPPDTRRSNARNDRERHWLVGAS